MLSVSDAVTPRAGRLVHLERPAGSNKVYHHRKFAHYNSSRKVCNLRDQQRNV